MVERPIKKSERQAQADTEGNPENKGNSENKSFTPPVKSNRKDKDKDRDNDKDRGRGKGRGRKSSGRDEIKPPVNPALARPPKPTKPPAKVEPLPEEVSETVAEDSVDASEAATEVVTEESQDSNEAATEVVTEESQDSNEEQNNS